MLDSFVVHLSNSGIHLLDKGVAAVPAAHRCRPLAGNTVRALLLTASQGSNDRSAWIRLPCLWAFTRPLPCTMNQQRIQHQTAVGSRGWPFSRQPMQQAPTSTANSNMQRARSCMAVPLQ